MSLISCSRWRAPLLHVFDEALLLVGQLARRLCSARRSENPTMAFSGVRNSWLMLARNWLFNLRGALHLAVLQFQFLVGNCELRGALFNPFFKLVWACCRAASRCWICASISLNASIRVDTSS